MMLGPTLETERLILRPPAPGDFDRWAEFLSDPEAARYIGGPQVRTTAWRSMATMTGAWSLVGFSMFSAIERSTGRWVGRLGPWMPEGWPGTEVGWGLHPDSQGRGYAVEGAAAAIDWAFDTLGWTEVIHTIAPENTASVRVAERLGSRKLRETRLPPPFEALQVEVWGQSREAWRARQNQPASRSALA
jgi:RimJ/RimL family protein N-acetyltransferase